MLCSAQAETRISGESTKVTQDTSAALRPVIRLKPALPTSRPDKALAYPSTPVSITLPVPKPDLEDVFPRSTATISEMIRKQTGLNAVSEMQLTLRAGEGIGALLRRSGYDSMKISAAVKAIAGKANLRRLQIGTQFQVTNQGFRFMAKPGRDVYVIHHPESGWLALTALRPTESYISFLKAPLKNLSISLRWLLA